MKKIIVSIIFFSIILSPVISIASIDKNIDNSIANNINVNGFLNDQELQEVILFTESMDHTKWWWDSAIGIYGLVELSKVHEDYDVTPFLRRTFDEFEANVNDNRTAPLRRFPKSINEMQYVNDFPTSAVLIYLNSSNPKTLYSNTINMSTEALFNWPARSQDGTYLHMYNRTSGGFEKYVWADTPYMITIFLVEKYKNTNDIQYLNLAIEQFMYHKRDLVDLETGLFNHGYNEFDKQNGHNGRNGIVWGRGNGWPYLTLIMILESLPKNHPMYLELKNIFIELSQNIYDLQNNSGKWNQVLNTTTSYEENSVTLMNSIGFLKGYNQKILPNNYFEAGVKGIKSISNNVENGKLYGVCEGMRIRVTIEEYNQCPTINPTDFGQGFLLLAYAEILKYPINTTITPIPTNTPTPNTIICGPLDAFGQRGESTPDSKLHIFDFIAFRKVYQSYCSDVFSSNSASVQAYGPCGGKNIVGGINPNRVAIEDFINLRRNYNTASCAINLTTSSTDEDLIELPQTGDEDSKNYLLLFSSLFSLSGIFACAYIYFRHYKIL
jgi:rhamnogalacturonyl hydrolase YesR